jgi:inward rectifier potassium channel
MDSEGRKPADKFARALPGVAPNLISLGIRQRFLGDTYHRVLTTSWPRLVMLLVALYLAANVLFALAYLALPGGIQNARPGSFADAFFFSVQTMATIGYGYFIPQSLAVHIVVTVEAIAGLLGFSVGAGLMFAKFSRPTARVMFSRVAVIRQYEGVPSLIFRIANERNNQIASAQLRVALLVDEYTPEGDFIRKLYDMRLRRGEHPAFMLSWTAVHPIDEQSPLYGQTRASLEKKAALIVASLTGLDETFSQTVYARHLYAHNEIVWNAKFVDLFSRRADGSRVIDFTRIHDVEREADALSKQAAG